MGESASTFSSRLIGRRELLDRVSEWGLFAQWNLYPGVIRQKTFVDTLRGVGDCGESVGLGFDKKIG